MTSISTTGPAYGRLNQNDIIVEVVNPQPRRPIRTAADLERVLDGLDRGDFVSFLVLRRVDGGYAPQTQVVNLQVN